ncbi:hypothetical protein ACFYYB_26855 [Streptomyces sp. NPDC002886]|uniref:hypothetical protein n=1 Tax=Streptomyces sp. NPDC002886 TaxID=3364667 RepID=UPI0036BBB353
MKHSLRVLSVGCTALVAAALLATTGKETTISTKPIADEGPGYAIETFEYPLADKILAEKNIRLKRGDGNITLADCASETGLLVVFARKRDEICFKVTGSSGWLTLEMPAVYGIRGSATQTAQVDMTVGTEAKSFDVAKDVFTPVGEVTENEGRDHTLVEIRTAK